MVAASAPPFLTTTIATQAQQPPLTTRLEKTTTHVKKLASLLPLTQRVHSRSQFILNFAQHPARRSQTAYNMHRQGHLRPQVGHGGSGNHGSSGSSDDLAHSSSPGGINRQARLARPVIKPSASPVNRVKTPEQSYTTHSRADSSLSPGRPNREHSSFTLNGQHINETWKPRPSAFTGPTQPPTPMSPAKTINRPILRVDTQHASDRQTPRNHHSHWASQQESKVRILRLPKQWWTQDVYHAMSRFGTVVKIEMENSSRNNGSRANNAWVSFQ